jgi:hypothetical protein
MDDLKERGRDLKTLVTNGINVDRALLTCPGFFEPSVVRE